MQFLTSGDLSSMAMACPHLKTLQLSSCFCCGPLFAALRPLTALKNLHLKDISVPDEEAVRPSGVFMSLSQLAGLTSLMISVYSLHIFLDDVLPHLDGLTSLASLSLGSLAWRDAGNSVRDAGDSGELLKQHGQGILARLTSLDLCKSSALRLTWLDLAIISPYATQLTSLILPWTLALDDSMIKVLAARLPNLVQLSARAMAPKEDLSMLPCSWTSLTLRSGPSPWLLLRLPLRGVKSLSFSFWTLRVTSNEAAPVREAAELLGPRWHHIRNMCIQRKGKPNQSCDALLEALAPLGAGTMTDLRLQGWDVGSSTAAGLAASLPGLGAVSLMDCNVSGEALQALGCKMSLRELRLHSRTRPAVLRKALAAIIAHRRSEWKDGRSQFRLSLGDWSSQLASVQLDRMKSTLELQPVVRVNEAYGRAGKAVPVVLWCHQLGSSWWPRA